MYNAAVWLQTVEQALGDELEVDWKCFSLQQVNSKNGPEWKAWEQPASETRSILSLRGGVAARRQGPEAFKRYHIAVMEAKQKDRKPLNDPEVILDVARGCGLDLERFKRDLEGADVNEVIAREHTEAVEQYGVFGTPTFVFEDGHSAFLKMAPPREGDEVATFRAFIELIARRPFIGEIKHPQPPWPTGIYD